MASTPKIAWYDRPFMQVKTALPIMLLYTILGIGASIYFRSLGIYMVTGLGAGLFMWRVNPRQHALRVALYARK
jgi:hypothetical protein